MNLLNLAPTKKTYLKNKLDSFVELEILYLLAHKRNVFTNRKWQNNAPKFTAICSGLPVSISDEKQKKTSIFTEEKILQSESG